MKKIILITILFLSLIVSGCSNQSSNKAVLPVGAINIQDVGNGWSEFTYKHQRILFHKSYKGYKGYQSMVVIGGE